MPNGPKEAIKARAGFAAETVLVDVIPLCVASLSFCFVCFIQKKQMKRQQEFNRIEMKNEK